ncbi:MAG TPA: fatty acid oxidation complex subunit alpha FadJ [Gemmatimonadales bacterium]|nr:fatty acid oxidation complex subunit alpha FadJ [Gemmatimonadales bacterium]
MPVFSVDTRDGVAVLTLDVPGQPVNTLNADVQREIDELLPRLAADAAVRSVVLISGKPDNFVAGADIEQFTRLTSAEEGAALSRGGQEMAQRLQDFPKPIVVAIHGACLGGGLELSLACTWRVISDHPKTQLGLPEIQLGIVPGAGGCERLPRLIGLRAALDIILAGKSERAAKAFKLGMADELVHPAILRDTAVAAARRLADRVPLRAPRPSGLMAWFLDRTRWGRALVFRGARAQVLRKTGGNYPAPLKAIDVIRTGYDQGLAAGFAAEHQAFGDLAVTDVSRNLVRLFFADTALKKDDFGTGGARPREVRRLGVIGSGFMGAAIAGTAVSNAAVEVRLKDAELARVGRGLKAATGLLDERLKRRRITRPEHQRLTALLTGAEDFRGFRHVDLVIEAVFEDLTVKRQVLKEVEAAAPDAVFATNTSTIPIGDIGADAARPERVIGMHFFSPVDKMPLLEVIPSAHTGPEAIATAVAFGRRMGKKVVVVQDRPGFWVNRILTPYLNEAGRLLQEGTPIKEIDAALTRFGFPVGPIALIDEVGIDVAQKAGKVMHAAFGERLEPSGVVGTMIADKRLGKKNGRGFYVYHDGHKTGPDESVYDLLGVHPSSKYAEDIERRLVCAMLNEAALAFAEGVVRSPRDGDLASVFGIGFPPFRGGPLRLIDTWGAAKVVEMLSDLASHAGPRFTPAPALVEMARSGKTYY